MVQYRVAYPILNVLGAPLPLPNLLQNILCGEGGGAKRSLFVKPPQTGWSLSKTAMNFTEKGSLSKLLIILKSTDNFLSRFISDSGQNGLFAWLKEFPS